ncbi:uncharacterized protein EV154DRAFT_607203 [Mucor mucedo]|uniref:uncharacterized protein n=1 Tax=Mucor mucedo TaxID=29922 RepID=UPI00221F1635|nr:uncharacterized protein EV154DRAFT_607203 [Mucor mucedo]KAI7873335.1 hypothetical protein EV154DRAFT_607203 [Mucor mucedo]
MKLKSKSRRTRKLKKLLPWPIKTTSQTHAAVTLGNSIVKLEEDDKSSLNLLSVTRSARGILIEPLYQDFKLALPESVRGGKSDNLECNVCKLTFIDWQQLNMHLEPCHGINGTRIPRLLNRENLYCFSCKKECCSRSSYSSHLKRVHNIIGYPAAREQNSDFQPIIDEVNRYCNVCNRTYQNMNTYRIHLRRAHRMESVTNTCLYCKICGVRLSKLRYLVSHRKRVHYGPKFVPTAQAHAGSTTPDFYDENNQCSACKITFDSTQTYRSHLLFMYGPERFPDAEVSDPQTKYIPTVTDENCCCSVCERTFYDTQEFYQHLLITHQAQVSPDLFVGHSSTDTLIVTDAHDENGERITCDNSVIGSSAVVLNEGDPHINTVPNLDNDNNQCTGCKRTFNTKDDYRSHILTKYGSKALTPIDEIDPHFNTVPDINDVNKQCIGCKKQFETRINYFAHLRRSYGADIIPAYYDPHLDTVPSIDYTNNECIGSGKRFTNRTKYYEHLKSKYKNIINVTENFKTSCTYCEEAFECTYFLRLHLRRNHCPAVKKRDPHVNTIPDVNDINYQCFGCKKSFKTEAMYHMHLTNFYNVDYTKGPYDPHLNTIPIIEDENRQCIGCKNTYRSNSAYWSHLDIYYNFRQIGSYKLNSKGQSYLGKSQISILPNEHNKKNYCTACDRIFIHRLSYIYHMSQEHGIYIYRLPAHVS